MPWGTSGSWKRSAGSGTWQGQAFRELAVKWRAAALSLWTEGWALRLACATVVHRYFGSHPILFP